MSVSEGFVKMKTEENEVDAVLSRLTKVKFIKNDIWNNKGWKIFD